MKLQIIQHGSTEENATENKDEAEQKETITITSITVDTFGIDYGMPEVFNFDGKYDVDASGNSNEASNSNTDVNANNNTDINSNND